MASQQHSYIPIPKPNDETRSKMKKHGFKFLDLLRCSSSKFTDCSIPSGWLKEVYEDYVYFCQYKDLNRYTDNEFMIENDTSSYKLTTGEQIPISHDDLDSLNRLHLNGFENEQTTSIARYPGGAFEFDTLTIPQGWSVEITLYNTHNICVIFNPEGIIKYGIRNNYYSSSLPLTRYY